MTTSSASRIELFFESKAQDKLGEAAVWALGTLGVAGVAAARQVEHGGDDTLGYGISGLAIIAGYNAYRSARKGIDFRKKVKSAHRLRELGEKPGVLEAVMYRVADDETLADPRLQESIRQAEAGEVTEITDADLDEIETRTAKEE